jgi:hypothetical protein
MDAVCSSDISVNFNQPPRRHIPEDNTFHNVYTSPKFVRVIISRRVRYVEHVARMEEVRNIYTILIRITEAKFSLGRYRRRWEDNIKMGRRKKRCEVLFQNKDQA